MFGQQNTFGYDIVFARKGNNIMSDPDIEHPTSMGITVVVNGRKKTVATRELSFEALVEMAFPGAPPNEGAIYTITYSRGEGHKPEGILVAGESVKLKEGMIFNVIATSRS